MFGSSSTQTSFLSNLLWFPRDYLQLGAAHSSWILKFKFTCRNVSICPNSPQAHNAKKIAVLIKKKTLHRIVQLVSYACNHSKRKIFQHAGNFRMVLWKCCTSWYSEPHLPLFKQELEVVAVLPECADQLLCFTTPCSFLRIFGTNKLSNPDAEDLAVPP